MTAWLSVPCSINGTDIVVAEADVVGDVPSVSWIPFPERFAHVLHDVVDCCICVVHQNVQLVLLRLNSLEQSLDLFIFSVIN